MISKCELLNFRRFAPWKLCNGPGQLSISIYCCISLYCCTNPTTMIMWLTQPQMPRWALWDLPPKGWFRLNFDGFVRNCRIGTETVVINDRYWCPDWCWVRPYYYPFCDWNWALGLVEDACISFIHDFRAADCTVGWHIECSSLASGCTLSILHTWEENNMWADLVTNGLSK